MSSKKTKYYKVIKENFLWEIGAIIDKKHDDKGYSPIDEIYEKHEDNSEYISTKIVEDSPEYFKRVYKVDLITRVAYESKEKARELLSNQFKNK